jgi:hypothetical protein
LTEHVNVVFVKLQSKDLIVSQQVTELEQLVVILSSIGVNGPCSKEEIEDIATRAGENSTFGRFWISHLDVIHFLYDQGTFIRTTFDDLSFELKYQVTTMVGKLVLIVIDGIISITTERDSLNAASSTEFPPVLPHELVQIRERDIATTVINRHIPQLLKNGWDNESISKIELQHRQLRFAYQHEFALKSALDKCDHNTSFTSGWKIVNGRFEVLRDFCGGIATVFPNTATVESDFSELGWEKDVYRKCITDLSLEGVLQCKQYSMMKSLSSLL